MNLKRDSIVVIITSVLGVVITYFITRLTGENATLQLILYCIILIVIIVVINYQQPITLMFTNPNNWKLQSTWISTWSYRKNGKLINIEDKIKISQIGCYIWGKGISSRINGDFPIKKTKYHLHGKINSEGIFFGEWENSLAGRNYYGTFLLKAERNIQKLQGRWIGVDNTDFNQGEWTWIAVSTGYTDEDGFEE